MRNLLGFYLLGVFSLVFLLVALWPPPQPDATKTAKREVAQEAVDSVEFDIERDSRDLEAKTKGLKDAQDAVDAGKSQPKDILDKLNAALTDAKNKKESADQQKQKDVDKKAEDEKSLEVAKHAECSSAEPLACYGPLSFESRLGSTLPRDIDLLFLVMIGGALGAFLHSARSFTDFVGNKEIKSSWAWWYYLHPFIGAALALTFYAAIRGGFLAISAGTSFKAQELSPFAVTSIAVLVGMFSKIATTKLGEIFETLFQPSKPEKLKDPLGSTVPPVAGTGAAPKITSIAPPAAGGGPLTITGSNFVDGAKVNIGGASATEVKWTSSTSIVAKAPSHASAGAVDVEVVNPDGQNGVLPGGYKYV
jgi:hypothetical protein